MTYKWLRTEKTRNMIDHCCHWRMHDLFTDCYLTLLARRVQFSRRMDQAALEVAASRQAAETAIAQVECCRMPCHSFVFLFQKGPIGRWYQNIPERFQVIDRFDMIWAFFEDVKVAALRAELASIIGQNGEEVCFAIVWKHGLAALYSLALMDTAWRSSQRQ